METRNITVMGVWAFAIVFLVGAFFVGADMLVTLMLFFIAVIVSIALSATSKPSQASPDQHP